jgi:hypothetical protein
VGALEINSGRDDFRNRVSRDARPVNSAARHAMRGGRAPAESILEVQPHAKGHAGAPTLDFGFNETILTRRANQVHSLIVAQSASSSSVEMTAARFRVVARKTTLHNRRCTSPEPAGVSPAGLGACGPRRVST